MARAAGRNDLIAKMHRQDSPGDAHFIVGHGMGKAAVVTAVILDLLKGFVPALVARVLDVDHGSLAWIGVAAVAGHSFAPFLRTAGGRGLTTAAGVSLAIIPKAMVGSGVIALVGTAARYGGQGTSLGFSLLPLFAWIFGYDGALIAMAGGILGLIAIRRLEGIEEDRRAGVSLTRAVAMRLLFDLPGRPGEA
jgi:glycerol-3-phosphate acyltransferase PlsY